MSVSIFLNRIRYCSLREQYLEVTVHTGLCIYCKVRKKMIQM